MSEHDPVEIVRSVYAAVEQGDHAHVRRCLADDLRWRQAGTAVPAAGQDLVGADVFLDQVLEPIERSYEGFTEEIDRFIDDGRWVVATGTYRGTHRQTGRELVAEFCHLWEVGDGRIVGFRQYTDTAAFAAVTPG